MKKILILGASSDIGMAYIQRLEKTSTVSEVQIIAHYRTMSSKLGDIISCAKNTSIETIKGDLSLPEDVQQLISIVKMNYSSPTHILHLAAGQFKHMRLRQFDSTIARKEMEVQVFSFAEILKAFLPIMAKNKYGRIAVMLTAYTFGIPPKFVTDYVLCKYALLGLIKSAAAEYCDKGICINGLSPSMIETKFLDEIDSRIIEMSASGSPLKRNMELGEIITAIDFLLSDENSHMCGTNLNLSGGSALA